MAKLTPYQEVKQRFGSKEALARELIPVVERDEYLDDDEFERRILTASNKQLLRLHRIHETIRKRWGSKRELVDAIVAKKFPNGNSPYHEKLMQMRPSRLLDLQRQLS
jgi:hypothetical protein